jgi:hypothetical protein
LVAACEEYIGGEARIVESNGFINSGNSKGFARDPLAAGETFVPSWHRGADLPYASHAVGGLSHCNFVKALTNLTPLDAERDGGCTRASPTPVPGAPPLPHDAHGPDRSLRHACRRASVCACVCVCACAERC